MGLLGDYELKANPDLEQEYLRQILEQNKDKDFVQRILNYAGPNLSPTVDLKGTGYGDYGTHLMSGGQLPNGQQAAYPMIVNTPEGLKLLSEQEALQHAIKTNEYIPFPSVRDVNWFGQNYKKGSAYGGKW